MYHFLPHVSTCLSVRLSVAVIIAELNHHSGSSTSPAFSNDKLQGSVATYLRCDGVVSDKKIISGNIWQSYKQERDCLVHFLHLLAVCWPSAQVHLKYLATLPCDLSLMACFADINASQGSVATYMQGAVGFLISVNCKFT